MLLDTARRTSLDFGQASIARIRKMASDDQGSYRRLYEVLDAYYENNDLYTNLNHALGQSVYETRMKGLRNPAHAVIEFYVATVMPGPLEAALPIVSNDDALKAAIHAIWKASNLGKRKQPYVRWTGIQGDSFLKATARTDSAGNVIRPYIDFRKASEVTDFEEDERGFITYIRLDIPYFDESISDGRSRWYTEIWDKETDSFRVWRHDLGDNVAIDRLGTPAEQESITSFGHDFIPFVRATFRDTGEARGAGAFTHAIDSVDEANLLAMRLHQMLFRHNGVTWALNAGGNGPDNRPLPPPRLPGQSRTSSDDEDSGEVIDLGGERFLSLSGNGQLQPLVPPINYEAARAILRDQILSMEEYDLPELAYYRLSELSNTSGRALRTILSAPIARVEEVRGNLETALQQVTQMCLTIGSVHQLPVFRGIGTFENGDFEHAYAPREVIHLSDAEEMSAQEAEIRIAEMKHTALGIPLEVIWAELGYTAEEIKDMKVKREADLASLGGEFLRQIDQGDV